MCIVDHVFVYPYFIWNYIWMNFIYEQQQQITVTVKKFNGGGKRGGKTRRKKW